MGNNTITLPEGFVLEDKVELPEGFVLEKPSLPKEPLSPDEAERRAGEVWDLSVDLELPLFEVEENYIDLSAAKPKPKQDITYEDLIWSRSERFIDLLPLPPITEADIKAGILRPSKPLRFLAGVGRSFAAIPKAILTKGGLGKLDIELEQYRLVEQFKELTNREPTIEELDALRTLSRRNIYAKVQKQWSFFDIPASDTWGEKTVDVAAGVTGFIAKLIAAKKVLGGKPGLGQDVVAWEAVNMAEAGVPGTGAAMRLALGAVGKIPGKSIYSRAGRLGGESGVLAGMVAIGGGDREDIIVAALIPLGLRAVRLATQTSQRLGRQALENKSIRKLRKLGYDNGLDLTNVPDKSLRIIVQRAKLAQFWHKQADKGRISQDVLDMRLSEIGTELKPILKAIASQQKAAARAAKPEAPRIAEVEKRPPTAPEVPEKPTAKPTEATPTKIAAEATEKAVTTEAKYAIVGKGKTAYIPEEVRAKPTEAKPAPAVSKEGKEAWEMTREEYFGELPKELGYTGDLTQGAINRVIEKNVEASNQLQNQVNKEVAKLEKQGLTREQAWAKVKQTKLWEKFVAPETDLDKLQYKLEHHRREIRKALSEGKPIPREVLKEYKTEKWAKEALRKEGEKVKFDDFTKHIDDPRMKPGFATIPASKTLEKVAERTKDTAKNIKEDIDQFRFYPKAPPEFRNDVRKDLVGAMTKAADNVYKYANDAIWGELSKDNVRKSVEIIFARDQLSRTKIGKGNPEIDLEEATDFLDDALTDASPEAIAAADRWKIIHDKYTDKLIERGVLEEGQRIEDHVRHYIEDYTPEWAPTFGIPARLKRPFRGYAKKAVGTTKEYRQDQEALLASLLEMEHHNLVEDFIERQVKKYDIKPSLSKEIRRELFGIDARGYAKTPRPGRIYIVEDKRYRAYTPDIPFSRAIYLTEEGEAALGSFKNVALLPEDIYNLFRDFSQRGSRGVYLLNRATGYWKTMAILAHFPSFNVNNFVGDTWIALVQHPEPLRLLEELDTSIRYLTGRLKGDYAERLDAFVKEHDVKQTFISAELRAGRASKNPVAWIVKASYKFSDKRESIDRVAYASSLLRGLEAGRGQKLVEAHDWIDTDGLSTEDALGKIAREVLTDYGAVSKPFRRFVRGGIAPFGTFYFKTSARVWKWLSKHPFKATAMFLTLPLAALAYNRRNKKIAELETRLPDYIRNRTHFILSENPDGSVRTLSLQLPQDVLIGTKIFSVLVDHGNRVIGGEMTPKEAAVETLKRWGITEYEGVKYLLSPWIRLYSGLKSGKDPYDKANVYRRDYNKMVWDEKAKDIAAYILKTAVPFLGYSIQTYEKGLPQDVAIRKIFDRLAGKGAFGIYDINKKGQIVFEEDGEKIVYDWDDIFKANKLVARELKYLGRLEDAFVASNQPPDEFLASDKAKKHLLDIYKTWSKEVPDLDNPEIDDDSRIMIVVSGLDKRLENRVMNPRVLGKWYQVKISRAKTAKAKREIGQQYEEIKKLRLLDRWKKLPKTAREIQLIKKVQTLK